MKQLHILSPLALAVVAAISAAPYAHASGVEFGPPEPLSGGHALVMRGDHQLPQIVTTPKVLVQAQHQLEQLTAKQVQGAQVVTLTWEPHGTYTIPIRTGMFSTLSFPKSEPIQQFAVSNPEAVSLEVNAVANVAMLKLKQPLVVTATVVTTKHIFYLQITPADDEWYQGVSWSFDDVGAFGGSNFGGGMYQAPTLAQAQAVNAPSSPEAGVDASLYSGDPNFNYLVSGNAPFRPTAVWDNGRFTWVQFASNLQELPALFAKGANGLEIVNYSVHNHSTQLLVNRLMPEFVLKLGQEEITVKATGGAAAALARGKGSN